MVTIIDDRCDVWRNARNLVRVKEYTFFDGTGDVNAPPTTDTTHQQTQTKILKETALRVLLKVKTESEINIDNSDNVLVDTNLPTELLKLDKIQLHVA